MSKTVIGWVDAYLSPYQTVTFTEEHERALVERIRKRRYNFTYQSHQTLPYCAPFYEDKTLCVLTKTQWDNVLAKAYKEVPMGPSLIPMDVIEEAPAEEILFEKPKFREQFNKEK